MSAEPETEAVCEETITAEDGDMGLEVTVRAWGPQTGPASVLADAVARACESVVRGVFSTEGLTGGGGPRGGDPEPEDGGEGEGGRIMDYDGGGE